MKHHINVTFFRIFHGEFDNHVDFRSTPEIHNFPPAMASKTQNIQTTVFALPRFDLETLISMSPYRKYNLPIERQILISSRSKNRTVHTKKNPQKPECLPKDVHGCWHKNGDIGTFSSSSKGLCDNKEIMDDENTPGKMLEGLKINEKTLHQGVVFMGDAKMLDLEKKSPRIKNAKISDKLRKRLSFENAENEPRCYQIEGESSFINKDKETNFCEKLPTPAKNEMKKEMDNVSNENLSLIGNIHEENVRLEFDRLKSKENGKKINSNEDCRKCIFQVGDELKIEGEPKIGMNIGKNEILQNVKIERNFENIQKNENELRKKENDDVNETEKYLTETGNAWKERSESCQSLSKKNETHRDKVINFVLPVMKTIHTISLHLDIIHVL